MHGAGGRTGGGGWRCAGSLRDSSPACGDAALCVLLLLICLAYETYAGIAYLSSFSDDILDFALRPIGRDFVNYWAAGAAVFDGALMQIFDASLFHPYQERLLGRSFVDHNWSYPPHMLLLIWPLGQLPYLWALAAWSFLGLAVYLWASTAGRRDAGLLLLALLVAPATYENFAGGQNGFFTAALLIGGLRLLGSRPVLAGILFGILTVKPQLGILLPLALLAARQWQAIAAAGVTAAIMVGTSVLWFGWESWQAYIDLVVPYQAQLMSAGRGVFLTMMPSAYIGLRLVEAEPLIRSGVQVLFALLAATGVCWAFARSKDADLKFAVLAVGTFLAAPYSFTYDMTTVSLAVALIALRGLSEGFLTGERVALTVVWILPMALSWLNLVLPVGSLILLAFFVYLLVHIRRSLDNAPASVPAWWAKADGVHEI